MTKIVFEPLPPRTGGPKKRSRELVALAKALTANPNEWARVGVYRNISSAASMASVIKRGKLAVWAPAGAFEACSRTVDGQARVYARYVGTTPAGGEQA